MNSLFKPEKRRVGKVLLALAFLPAYLSAQESRNVPPPRDPVLARAPERAEWTITLRPDRDKALEGEAPKEGGAGEASRGQPNAGPISIRVTKDGTTYREIARRGDRGESEKWIVDGLQVRTGPNGRLVRVMPPTTFFAPDFSDYSRSDFEMAEWIALSNFSGVRTYRGADIYVFETAADQRRLTPREEAERANGSLPERTRDPARKFTAFVDLKTRLPLLIDDGEVVSVYEYTGTSPQALVPPPRIAEAIARWKKEIKRKTAVPLPP